MIGLINIVFLMKKFMSLIGLTLHSGIPYMGIVYLVNRVASKRA